jgi:hypothetical protein
MIIPVKENITNCDTEWRCSIMVKNKRYRAAAVLLAAISIVSFTACSQQNASASVTASESATSMGQTTIYGKVTAVDGTKVTMDIGTLPESNRVGGAAQSGRSGGKRQGNSSETAPSSKPEQGTPPSGGQGGEWNQLTLTGTSKTITISNTSILTKGLTGFGGRGEGRAPNGKNGAAGGSGGNTSSTNSTQRENNTNSISKGTPAALTDITVGSILRVTYDTSSQDLVSVQIMGNFGKNQTSSTASSDS